MFKKKSELLKPGSTLLVSALLSAGVLSPLSAYAADEDSGPLEQVIVTATKRETTLMDTAVSVSAMNQVELTNQGVKDGRDLGELVPNLFVSLDQSQNQIELTLRGIGSTNLEQISDPTVGLHVDGLYQPRPQSAMALMFDLERLEVLRGPQGTLFGRNSTAGTVNIIPAKPVIGEFSGSTQLTIGEYNRQGLQNILNLPLGDSFAVRLAMMSDKRDSYIKQIQDFEAPDQRRNLPVVHKEDWYFNNDQRGARLSALWDINDSASWLLAYDRFDDDSAGGTRLRNCRQWECRPGVAGTPERPGFGRDIGTADVYANSVDTVGRLNIEQDSFRSIFSIDVADLFQIKHSFGYIDLYRTQVADDDGGFTNFVGFQQTLETVQSNNLSRTNELQFQSLGDGPFQWTAGYWTLEENNDFRLNVDLQFIPGAVIILWPANTIESEAIFFDTTYALSDTLRLNFGARQSDDKKSAGPVSPGGEVWLGFGADAYFGDPAGTFEMTNGTFAFITDDSNVVNEEEMLAQGWVIAGTTNLPEPEVKSDKLTYKIGAEYDLNEDTLTYVTLATGYKAAPFDTVLTDPSTGNIRRLSVKPEEVTNLEFGYKTTVLDGSLNLSAALFLMNYEDMQRTTLAFAGNDPITDNPIYQLVTTNASEANINGIELEFDWALSDVDRLKGWVSYIDATFDKYSTVDNWYCAERQALGETHPGNAPAGTSPCGTNDYPLNLKGDNLAKTPEVSFQVAYEHEFVFGSGAKLVPWISMHYESSYYLRDFNQSIGPYNTKQGSFQTFDFNLRYTSAEGQWYGEIFGTNITDELVATRADTFGGAYTHNYNEPEMWGARLGVEF